MEQPYDYVVIGAGPAGLQLGYHLQQSGHRYLILEGGDQPGTFFQTFPRHRKLISINKIHTGSTDPEFNMRHDWNSVLSDDEDVRFKEYDQDFFPSADKLVTYLRDYTERHALNVRYRAFITRVGKVGNEFHVTDQNGHTITSRFLVVATGLSKPLLPCVPGIELTENYMDMSLDTAEFCNKRVLILGKGNSAFETADHLVSSAALIHLASPNPITMAWKSHYVGHLRAVNNNVLDTYQLKSQNAVLDAQIQRISKRGEQFVVEFAYNHANGEIEEICYDRVLCCTGFRFDASIFDESARPEVTMKGKYPSITVEFESKNVPGLYFAGTIMHSLDYRKTTSGFIHGFRYNVRALSRILDLNHHGKTWPRKAIERNKDALVDVSLARVNRAGGLWQQPGFMADVITQEGDALYYHNEMPIGYAAHYCMSRGCDYFTVTLEYGDPIEGDPFMVDRIHRKDTERAARSQFLHPVVRHYQGGMLAAEHHVVEDLEALWVEEEHTRPLAEFFQSRLELGSTAPMMQPETAGA
jgi:thioredoxin reductase